MKKFIVAILTVMILVSTASAFNPYVLKRRIIIRTDNPKSFINPSFVVNERTSFQLVKFDITSVSFDRMLRMANKTLCQDPLDNEIRKLEELSKSINASRAKLKEYKIPNKTNK